MHSYYTSFKTVQRQHISTQNSLGLNGLFSTRQKRRLSRTATQRTLSNRNILSHQKCFASLVFVQGTSVSSCRTVP